jgi:hypothetical protein
MKTIRLLLIEDNRHLRDGIAALVQGQQDIKVVGAFGEACTPQMLKRDRQEHFYNQQLGFLFKLGHPTDLSFQHSSAGIPIHSKGLVLFHSSDLFHFAALFGNLVKKDGLGKRRQHLYLPIN